jgi:signal peptidase I
MDESLDFQQPLPGIRSGSLYQDTVPIQVQLGQSQPPLDPAAEREKRRSKRFWSGAALAVVALSFIVILRIYAFEATVITSASMEPTLLKNDYALFDHRIALRGRWNRGDVVLFEAPKSWQGGGEEGGEQAGSFANELLAKRIIGMPGETVSILVGHVLINGQELTGQTFLKETPEPQVTIPITLGPDQYYVMGDNRNNSDDSRNNGPISESDIRGRVLRRVWPLNRAGAIESPDFGAFNTDN